METDRFFDQLKKMDRKLFRYLATGAGAVTLAACAVAQKQGWVDFTATPNNTPNPTETINPTENAPTIAELPKVGPVYENEVKAFLAGTNCGKAWAELGVTLLDIGGTYYGGNNLLFNTIDDTGGQRYCLLQSGGKETQLQYGFVHYEVGTLVTSEFILFEMPTGSPNLDGELVIEKKYFSWIPSEKDELGNTFVTFQSDGTPNTAQKFLLPPTTNIGPMGDSLITINYNPETNQIYTESPEPALPADVQKKFDDNETYSLTSNGQIEKTVGGVTSVVEEIKFNAEGKMVFTTQEGEEMLVDTAMLKVVDQRIIFRDKTAEPKTWMYDGEKLVAREYTPPAGAGWVTYEENLPDVNFVLNEAQANEQAIYENFLGLLPNSLKKTPWNEAITKIVQEKYGLEIVANGSPDREKRRAFIEAFLAESGGVFDIYSPLNKTTLEAVDMNLPIVHKSIQASTVPEGFSIINGQSDHFIAGNIVMLQNGQAQILLAHSPDILEYYLDLYSENGWSKEVIESLHFHMFLKSFASGSRALPFTGQQISDPRAYLLSGFKLDSNGDPDIVAYTKITVGFLKNK